jgi:peptide deformylase
LRQTIHTYGNSVLREKAQPVDHVNDETRQLAKDMIETMHAERGVGLAAQQINRAEAVCVVDVPYDLDKDSHDARQNPDVPMPLVLVNPEIIEFSHETEVGEEGCLSFPGISAPIRRSVEIAVRFMDLRGRPQNLRLKRFVARVVQHEIDHLNGILLVDRMSHIKKIALAGQLKRLKRETIEKLGAA